MPALNFKKRFVEPILNGSKTITFRKTLQRGIKYGYVLNLHTGMRTKDCTFIARVVPTQITKAAIIENMGSWYVWIGGVGNIPAELIFARDGFDTLDDFIELHEEFDNVTYTHKGLMSAASRPLWLINWGEIIKP